MATTVAQGASATVSLPAGSNIAVTGTGFAVMGPGRLQGTQYGLQGSTKVGPFDAAQTVYLTATTTALSYNVAPGYASAGPVVTPRNSAGEPSGPAIDPATGQPLGGGGGADLTSMGVFIPTAPAGGWTVNPAASAQAIIDAANAAAAAGGGYVELPATQIKISRYLPLISGVIYRGSLGGWDVGGIPDAPDVFPTSGTDLRDDGTGTYPCFWDGKTDGAETDTPPTGTQYTAGALSNGGVEEVYIRGFSFGVKCGAAYKSGPIFGVFDRIYVYRASQWGVWIENYMHCIIGTIHVCACTEGQMMWAMSALFSNGSTTLNMGNTVTHKLYAQRGTVNSRGIVFWGRSGTGMNDLDIKSLQVNSLNSGAETVTATFTNGSPNISVPDLSKFTAPGYITFQSNVAGFGGGGTVYVVRSKSAASGAGTITLAKGHTTAIRNASASTTGTIVLSGTPGVELYCSLRTVGSGMPGNRMLQSITIGGIDIENQYSAAVFMERAMVHLQCNIVAPTGVFVAARESNGIVDLACPGGSIYNDNDNASTVLMRMASTSRITPLDDSQNSLGIGLSVAAIDATEQTRSGLSNGGGVISLERYGYTLGVSKDGSFIRFAGGAIGYRHRVVGGNNASNNNFGGRNSLMVLNLSAGQTHTLETVVKDTNNNGDFPNGNVGKEMVLVNPTANPITVQCESANDVIIGGGTSSATKSLPAYSSVKVIACCKGTGAADGFWAWFAA